MQEYRINFADGTHSLIIVSDDEKPSDVAFELCEVEGWDTSDIVSIERQPIDSIASHQSFMSRSGNF